MDAVGVTIPVHVAVDIFVPFIKTVSCECVVLLLHLVTGPPLFERIFCQCLKIQNKNSPK